MKPKLSAVEAFGCAAFFLIFMVLGIVALSERSISFGGGRYGTIGHAEGGKAIFVGFSFLAGAFGAVAYGLQYTKYRAVYWAILFLGWCGVVFWYLLQKL